MQVNARYKVMRFRGEDDIWYYRIEDEPGSFMGNYPCNQGVPQEFRNFAYVSS